MRIAINGAGIGGPTLAWWLKHYGHDPIIIERAPALRRGGHLIDFWGSGYDIADKMGLRAGLHEHGYKIAQLRGVTSSGMTTSSLQVSAMSEMLQGRYTSIERSELSRHIYEACETKGIETRFGTHVTGFVDDGDKVTATFDDGKVESFDLMVGADGLHSATRKMLFGAEEQFERHLDLMVAAFVVDGYQPRDELTFVQFTKPHRQVSRISLRDDKTLFLMIFNKNQLQGVEALREEMDQKAALHSIFGGMGWEVDDILARLDEVEDVYLDRVSQIECPNWSKGRVALLGDAVACASLLAGEGTGLAITEAYFLAGELHKSGGDYETAFAAYQAQLKPFVEAKQAGARKFKGFFAPKSWFGLVLREAAMNLARIPGLTKPIIGSAITESINLPEY